jgi:hypothetical protein
MSFVDPFGLAQRAALLLGAPAACVVEDGRVIGHFGLNEPEVDDLWTWLDAAPTQATSWSGRLRRLARGTFSVSGAEVWVLGPAVRRLPEGAYTTLQLFLDEEAYPDEEAA